MINLQKKILFILDFIFIISFSYFSSRITINAIDMSFEIILRNPVPQIEIKVVMERVLDRMNYIPIIQRNIFDSLNLALKEELENVKALKPKLDLFSPPVQSDINAILIGTVIREDLKNSTAIINTEGRTKLYRVHDNINNEAKIIIIQRGRIEFIRNYRREYLIVQDISEVSTGRPIVKKEDGEISKIDVDYYHVDKVKFNKALNNLNEILLDAASFPNVVNGKIRGFQIVAIREDSLFDQLGIQDNDIIIGVNGKIIDSLNTVLTLFQTLKNENNFNITIERDKVTRDFKYVVK